MKIKNRPYFNREHLRTINDVEQALELLEHDLPLLGIDRLRNFNRTYLIITKRVKQHLRKKSFEDPSFLERFDTIFAYYYLDALHGYIEKRPIPAAWRLTFDTCLEKSASPLKCMALGVNAHVNNDISQVLIECAAKRRNYPDYLLVNNIISRSIDEVIDSVVTEQFLLNPKNRLNRYLYRLGMQLLIVRWRATAWRRYRKLVTSKLSQSNLELIAERTAKQLLKLPI